MSSEQRPSPWHDPAGWHAAIDQQVRDEGEQPDDEQPWSHERIAAEVAALMHEAVRTALLPSDDPRRVAFRVRKAALLAAIERLDEQQEAGR